MRDNKTEVITFRVMTSEKRNLLRLRLKKTCDLVN